MTKREREICREGGRWRDVESKKRERERRTEEGNEKRREGECDCV